MKNLFKKDEGKNKRKRCKINITLQKKRRETIFFWMSNPEPCGCDNEHLQLCYKLLSREEKDKGKKTHTEKLPRV